MNDFVPLAAAAALVYAAVNLLKHVTAKNWNAVATQVVVALAGIGVAFLLAASDFGEGIKVAGTTLGALNGASLVLVGTSLGATATAGYDAKSALDANDSAKTPPLVPPGA